MAETPFEDWRNTLQKWSNKVVEWDSPTQKKNSGKAPTAKSLGWADQSGMRDAKVGQKKKNKKRAKKRG